MNHDEQFVAQVIAHLNDCAGKKFLSSTKATRTLILARKKEGFMLEDFFAVNRKMSGKWLGTQWERYIRPVTLYNASKFEGYLNEPEPKTDHSSANWPCSWQKIMGEIKKTVLPDFYRQFLELKPVYLDDKKIVIKVEDEYAKNRFERWARARLDETMKSLSMARDIEVVLSEEPHER